MTSYTNPKRIVCDIDGTLCPIKTADQEYSELEPNQEMVQKLQEYREAGFMIILSSARNMRTYSGNVGLIQANTAKVLLEWLDRNSIPYDELYLGKPWNGQEGFYIDDHAIRPDEFLRYSYEEIQALLKK